MIPPPTTASIVDVLGFLTGGALYVMLVVMVCRERLLERAPLLSRRGRLPLLTGVFGFVWNAGALLSFGTRVVGTREPSPLVLAVSFAALGFLPAVVVQSLVEGREAGAVGRPATPAIWLAYGISTAAAALQIGGALAGGAVPSRIALWLLTGGFTALTVSLLVLTQRQSFGRRGLWVAALAIFAVSALHFENHRTHEAWWVELIGHHASLPLALAILLQDYRFAFADLFLKQAIALLLLMGVSLALFSGLVAGLVRRYDATGGQDPRAIAAIVGIWMLAAVVFPLLRRLSSRVVDRVVLRRPNYDEAIAALASRIDRADTEDRVLSALTEAVTAALGVVDHTLTKDDSEGDSPIVATGSAVRHLAGPCAAAVRIRTVEPPQWMITLGPPAGGRRLLSDDVRFLEGAVRLAARRLDAVRVAQERLERNVREQQIERLASEAELRALRAQLNPHFLFNALTTVGHLVQTAPDRALETLLRLSSVLRSILRRTSTEVSELGDELDLVQAYLEIEQARFQERLQIVFDVEPDARRATVPTLLLQPLVENAVKHGLAPLRQGGRITVSARALGETLIIAVCDTGLGFDPERARARAGVGLANVAQRLELHYGSAAALRIESPPRGGTTVELRLPRSRPLSLRRGEQKRAG